MGTPTPLPLAEYASHDATGLAELVACGQVSAAELHATALAALDAVDDELRAVVEGPWTQPLDYDPWGPFAGVPFVVKDILLHAAGVPSHCGSRMLRDGVAAETDTILMERFRKAGLATIASTTTPEFALNVTTEPILGGVTRNPWNPQRAVGGSSGGSAALVAAGVIPVAHANDGAGSIRIPAGHNGLVGLKPSRGRIPIGPDLAEVMYGLAVEFAVTRSVRDAAALLDALAGPHPGEKYTTCSPERPWAEEITAYGPPMRIAVAAQSWSDVPLHPQVRREVEATADLLTQLGHKVEAASPAVDWERLIAAETTIWCSGTAAAIYPLAQLLDLPVGSDYLEHTTIACAEAGKAITVVQLGEALSYCNFISREIGRFFEDWDVLLTPTAVGIAPPVGYFDADDASMSAAGWVRKAVEAYPHLVPFNMSGTPAMSVPSGLDDHGVPIGVQLAAGMNDEAALFRIAAQLEAARPAPPRPGIHVGRTVG